MTTITINEVEHEFDELPESVKICINRVQGLQAEVTKMKQLITEAEVVIAAYSDKVVQDMEAGDESAPEAEQDSTQDHRQDALIHHHYADGSSGSSDHGTEVWI